MNPFAKTSLDGFTPLRIDMEAAASSIENAVREELGDLSVSDDILRYQAD